MNSALTLIAPTDNPDESKVIKLRGIEQSAERFCEFKIHREDEVPVTSTLLCGGDWQWQLCSSGGHVLAKAGGFSSEHNCREAVAMLMDNAANAIVSVST